MLFEVEDSSVVPIQADSGIFISVEVAAIVPATCPALDSGSFVFNTEGGGGVRDGIATSDYNEYIAALAEQCEDLATPVPANYRTISFDEEYSDLEEQSVIRGDYVSFGFTYTSNSDLEVGWQCENLNNCPVAEVAKYYPGNAGTAIYIFKIDQGLAVGASFTMEFALVEDPDALPLVALDSIAVPFIGASGEPTCGLDDTL